MNPDLVITAFWAPFLLLHLGGPDTITAYSLEDNELWRRHALTLVTQVTTTVYVVLRCWTSTPLNFLALPIFFAGIIKSGERIWVLRYASSEHFRESMTHPSYRMSKKSPSYVLGLQFNVPVNEPLEYADILQNAYNFFKIFKQLLADVIVNFHDIENSRIIIKNVSSEDTFKMIEIELGFIYDVFDSKAVVLYSFVMDGFSGCFTLCCISLRCINFLSISSVSMAFLITEKHDYSRVYVIITYVLLTGAIILELYALILQLCSDWTMLWLSKRNLLHKGILSFLLTKKKRWCNTMQQYNIISISLQDIPAKRSFIMKVSSFLWKCIQKVLCIHGLLEKHRHRYSKKVIPVHLKQVILDQLQHKLESAMYDGKKLCAYRGDWVFQNAKSLDNIGRGDRDTIKGAIEVEFDESILLWHIATNLCFHSNDQKQDLDDCKDYRDTSQLLSNHMLYLLVFCPLMLPNGIGHIRFHDTRAEAIEFFYTFNEDNAGRTLGCKEEIACKKLLNVKNIPPTREQQEKTKLLLPNAHKLAHSMLCIENKWEFIYHVWVEMLGYAASHCQWNQHAQQLTQGGELLTHVWLLMAHLGITEQFKFHAGKG